MKGRRYAADYELVEDFPEKGAVKLSASYRGRYYYFVNDAGSIRAAKKRMLIYALAGWAAYIAAMFPPSSAMRSLYAALPMAFSALPLAALSSAALKLRKTPEPMERRRAELFSQTLPQASFILCFMSVCAFSGGLVSFFVKKEAVKGDLCFAAGAVILFIIGTAFFRSRRKISVKAADEQKLQSAAE